MLFQKLSYKNFLTLKTIKFVLKSLKTNNMSFLLTFLNKNNQKNKVFLNSYYNILAKKHLIKSVINLKPFTMLYKVKRIIGLFIGIIIIAYFYLSYVNFNCSSVYYQKKLLMLLPLLKEKYKL